MSSSEPGQPAGDPHDWFRRSRELLDHGDAAASLVLIDRVLETDPTSLAAREIRARALFDSQHFAESAEEFALLVDRHPDDDYAHYGLGMCLWRLQRFPESVDHLALAKVMKPHDERYTRAHEQVSATLRARRRAGLPLQGPIDPDAAAAEQSPAFPITPGTLITEIWPEEIPPPGSPASPDRPDDGDTQPRTGPNDAD